MRNQLYNLALFLGFLHACLNQMNLCRTQSLQESGGLYFLKCNQNMNLVVLHIPCLVKCLHHVKVVLLFVFTFVLWGICLLFLQHCFVSCLFVGPLSCTPSVSKYKMFFGTMAVSKPSYILIRREYFYPSSPSVIGY